MTQYPFSPELLDALPEEIAEHFRELERELLLYICETLKETEYMNEVSVQNIRALRSHGIDLDKIRKAITDSTGMSDKQLDKLIADVVERNQAYYTELIDFKQLTVPEAIVAAEDIAAIKKQCQREFGNITRSMGFLVDGGKTMLEYAKAYQWALDRAELEIQSGAISYSQAIKNAVKQLAESGIKSVDYESGHVDQIDVAARRAVMTGVNQLCAKYTEQSAEILDTPYFEVSAHIGARDKPGVSPWASHKDWQGKVYSIRAGDIYPDIYDVCGLGYVDGLEGANCRHRRFPFVEGFSERTYTDEQLKHIDDGHDCTYDGKHYSAYEATQMQRRLERTIRKQRRLRDAYKSAGLTDDARTANIKLRRLNAKYKEFNSAAKLPERSDRLKVLYTDDKSTQVAEALKLKRVPESATISASIGTPINSRNSTVGRPNAVSIFNAKLSKRQEALLAELNDYDSRVIVCKKAVSMKDLAALTAKTGNEFAMFTKGGKRLIIRGNSKKVNINLESASELYRSGYKWSGHTHPGYDELAKMASFGDVEVLKVFNQEQSSIYNSLGEYEVFRR